MLVTVPGVLDVIGTMIVQPPAGIVLPEAIVMESAATVTPGQVPLLGPVVVTPAGIGSVNAAVSVIGTGLALASVSVSDAVPPIAMVAGTMDLASVGGAFTVRFAVAGPALPALVDSVPVVLVTVPGVVDVIVTTIVQPPTGIELPAAIESEVAATVTPGTGARIGAPRSSRPKAWCR